MKVALIPALIAAVATGVAARVTPSDTHVAAAAHVVAAEAEPPTHVKRDVLASATDTGLAATGSISRGPFPDDLNGSNKTYDWPIFTYNFESNGIPLQMPFMDVSPCCMPNGKVMMLLHGKNFCSITWRNQISHFTDLGYRVIAIDNLGFCKASKEPSLQYSISFQAWVYEGLLSSLGIPSVIVMGHSFGGTMGFKFCLLFASSCELYVSVDAIGAEDYTAKGLTYLPIDANMAQEASSTSQSIFQYENRYYYVNDTPSVAFEWIDMLDNIYWGTKRDEFVAIQARVVDIVLTQPNAAYYPILQTPTFFVWGENDETYIGQWDAEMANKLGKWKEFAPGVCASMPNCTPHQFDTYGHSTQVSNPPLFNQVVGDWIYSAIA